MSEIAAVQKESLETVKRAGVTADLNFVLSGGSSLPHHDMIATWEPLRRTPAKPALILLCIKNCLK
jgi:hypothetical protein